jgi:hypothetical protein
MQIQTGKSFMCAAAIFQPWDCRSGISGTGVKKNEAGIRNGSNLISKSDMTRKEVVGREHPHRQVYSRD